MSIKKFCKGIKKVCNTAHKESVNGLLNKSKITIISNTEITIEGDLNVTRYYDSEIKVVANDISVLTTGSCLYLCFIKPKTLRITGKIMNVAFE